MPTEEEMTPIERFYARMRHYADVFDTAVDGVSINSSTVRTDDLHIATKHYNQIWQTFDGKNRFVFQETSSEGNKKIGLVGLKDSVSTVFGPINMFQMHEDPDGAEQTNFDYIELRCMDPDKLQQMVDAFVIAFPSLERHTIPYEYYECSIGTTDEPFKLRLTATSLLTRVKQNGLT